MNWSNTPHPQRITYSLIARGAIVEKYGKQLTENKDRKAGQLLAAFWLRNAYECCISRFPVRRSNTAEQPTIHGRETVIAMEQSVSAQTPHASAKDTRWSVPETLSQTPRYEGVRRTGPGRKPRACKQPDHDKTNEPE